MATGLEKAIEVQRDIVANWEARVYRFWRLNNYGQHEDLAGANQQLWEARDLLRILEDVHDSLETEDSVKKWAP